MVATSGSVVSQAGHGVGPVDMSTKVGGRVFHPALPVVDGSMPSDVELGFQRSLEEFCADNIPLESVAGIRLRERVLNQMGSICREWIQAVCVAKGLPADVVENAGGQLFTSGSYRLGVHEPGADIDTILVAPSFCRRQDFFGTNVPTGEDEAFSTERRDPNSLAERIRSHPDVTNFVPVEGAAVPLLTFDWEGINIDLLFARLNQKNSVPADFDIDNDAVLDGADSATEKSLNGPRVTNLIAAIVSGTPERYQTFLTVVRCVRKWAKNRGLYSNKMGYWGGVNINIGVALAIQLYPNACPASLLRKFFLIFKTWRWPQPCMLTKPHDAGYGLPVWSPHQQQAMGKAGGSAVAPMITPAYPAMNSTISVSRQTLQILQEEFSRAHEIVDSLWKQYVKHHSKQPSSITSTASHSIPWKKLFEPSDFFISYPLYLSLCIVGPSQQHVQSWAGFVESRLRKLVSDLLSRSLPIKKIQLWPKKLEVCIADKGALLTHAQRQNCLTYFIGYRVDKSRMRGDQLNVEIPLQNFREWDLSRYHPLVPGMDVLVKSFAGSMLPRICFENIYEGGKAEAMKRRRMIRNADPARQERKRLAKLEELKAKMANLQEKKRKREQQEMDEAHTVDDANINDTLLSIKNETMDEENGQPAAKISKTDHGLSAEIPSVPAVPATTIGTPNTFIDMNTHDTITTNEPVVESEETFLLQSALDTIEHTLDVHDPSTTANDNNNNGVGLSLSQTKAQTGEFETDDYDDPNAAKIAYEDDVIDDTYIGEGARQIFMSAPATSNITTPMVELLPKVEGDGHGRISSETVQKDKRSLPIPIEVAEFLGKLNYFFVSDEEMKILSAPSLSTLSHNQDRNSGDDNLDKLQQQQKQNNWPVRITFRGGTKFDDSLVELDPNGRVIDNGDEDYIPSKQWNGSMAGFEFKLGLRGLGYYRTGKEVVVPSNIAY